jgi:hypothetical protein
MAEIEAGDVYAKDWQDEAKQIMENTVRSIILLACHGINYVYTRWLRIIKLGPLMIPTLQPLLQTRVH